MSTIRVLLIDDHPIVRSGMRMLLEQADDIAVVGEAEHGGEAVQIVQALQPDVVLLDMEMPGKSGIEVAQELRQSGLPVRILALSAYDDEQYIVKLLESGAAGYLTKEEALNTIIDAVRGVAYGEEGWITRRIASRIAAKRGAGAAAGFSEIERQALYMLSKSWSRKKIASELGMSDAQADSLLSALYDKLNVATDAEAVRWAQGHRVS